jgi:ribosomal-protein-alanine N-acetyltransferase
MDYRHVFKFLPTLETPRLTLRRLRTGDAADIHAYASDPQVARYTLWEAHKDLEHSRLFVNIALEQYLVGQPSTWGVVLKETGRVIGTCGFAGAWEHDGRVELGYALARAHWGQGLMSEALCVVIAFCFETMQVHRVEAQCNEHNIASWRVMEKAGMRYEGTLRDCRVVRGEHITCRIYAILRQDLPR